MRTTIIGNGTMGKALQRGIANTGLVSSMYLCGRDSSMLKGCIELSDIVFIATPTLAVQSVLAGIRDCLKGKIVVFIQPDISYKLLKEMVGVQAYVVRMMPSIAVEVNSGAIGMYAKGLPEAQYNMLYKLVAKLGTRVDCRNEKKFDMVTKIGACAPAVTAYFAFALSGYCRKDNVLKRIETRDLVNAMLRGTSALMTREETNYNPQDIIDKIACEGGITEKILLNLHSKGFVNTIIKSLE